MYNSKLLNKFYEDLFSTDFNDYETPTQNAKTDYLLSASNYDANEVDNITFEDWLNELIETHAQQTGLDKQDIVDAVNADPQFIEDMKDEFEYLKEETKEVLDEEN